VIVHLATERLQKKRAPQIVAYRFLGSIARELRAHGIARRNPGCVRQSFQRYVERFIHA
jgi:hypothetical protein